MRIDNEVSDVLANSTINGALLFLPPGQLERDLYVKVNKVLEAIGGKWKRALKAHEFDSNPESIVEEVLLTGQYTTEKKEFQFYETPPELVARLIEIADYAANSHGQTHLTTLEPSAGHGAIASQIPHNPGTYLVELDPKKAERLGTKFADLHVDCADFMEWEPRSKFDRVVMNPPFSRQQDIDHIARALGFLKAGGMLVAIMSAAILYRSNKKAVEFRERIESLGGTIEPLPEESFKASGTMAKTCLVVVNL